MEMVTDGKFATVIQADGETTSVPLVDVPLRERTVWENEALQESLIRGLEQSARGETVDLGDFTEGM